MMTATVVASSEVTVVNDVVSHLEKRSVPEAGVDPQTFPNIRSGSYADIGPRRSMEDEHIRIDDLSPYIMGSSVPNPTAFYGVFDGHGGQEAAAYLKNNVTRLFFQNEQIYQGDDVEKSLREAFLLADSALADDSSVGSSSGTTALTALLLGRLLVVANAGDCRAVLCRKGEAIDMSNDHRPTHPTERRRIEELGGFVDDGYLNGVLSVTRALGDWDMKLALGTASSLIADPEIQQMILTEDDEFLILGCDGIWDVLSSQQAVSRVRRGLRRHDDPEQCAKDLVREALRLGTYDNLTVIVVCFTSMDYFRDTSQHKLKCFSIPTQAFCSFKNLRKK
uniref:probable protein phosphatase 2C 49 isoform X2 n=1 Tax=Erigeron canadensis TaxID=72917 RepID=UPI001CB931F4|nr:probable protein phosphatase 2C 49 isoform X2 [Erigeron canadensis]